MSEEYTPKGKRKNLSRKRCSNKIKKTKTYKTKNLCIHITKQNPHTPYNNNHAPNYHLERYHKIKKKLIKTTLPHTKISTQQIEFSKQSTNTHRHPIQRKNPYTYHQTPKIRPTIIYIHKCR